MLPIHFTQIGIFTLKMNDSCAAHIFEIEKLFNQLLRLKANY